MIPVSVCGVPCGHLAGQRLSPEEGLWETSFLSKDVGGCWKSLSQGRCSCTRN